MNESADGACLAFDKAPDVSVGDRVDVQLRGKGSVKADVRHKTDVYGDCRIGVQWSRG